jgi:ubiquinone/menaquinone biosynthesis C-methylase UbiE
VSSEADPHGERRVLERERAFWNERYASFGSETARYSEESFSDSITPAHEKGGSPGGLVHRRAHDLLLKEGIAGKRVLDYCCGRGKWSIHLAALGADVSGFDLSTSGIAVARERAARDGFQIPFEVADARHLPFPDAAFDIVVGISALEHSIKYEGTGSELRRVLAPRGLAIFTENLGQNPLINFARRFTMRGEEDAGDVLLTEAQVRAWAAGFAEVRVEGYSLLYMAKRVIPARRRILRFLLAVDSGLFTLAPGLRRYGGECVVVLRG